MALTDTKKAKDFTAGAPNITLKGDLRPKEDMAYGGRAQYGLGSLVKSVKKAVKGVVKGVKDKIFLVLFAVGVLIVVLSSTAIRATKPLRNLFAISIPFFVAKASMFIKKMTSLSLIVNISDNCFKLALVILGDHVTT